MIGEWLLFAVIQGWAMPQMPQFSLALLFILTLCVPSKTLLAQEAVKQNLTTQAPGCYDANRFCISISPPTNGNYEVYAQRKVPLPLVLTLSASGLASTLPTSGLTPGSTSSVFFKRRWPYFNGGSKKPATVLALNESKLDFRSAECCAQWWSDLFAAAAPS